jgi:hypothetical protein
MLVDIQTFDLFLLINSQTNCGPEGSEQNEGRNEDERSNRCGANDLAQKLIGTAAVEETLLDDSINFNRREQTNRERAKGTAYSVNAYCTHGVINLDFVEE